MYRAVTGHKEFNMPFREKLKGDTFMRRRILAACMAMCMAAATVVTSPWGGGMTAYAAEDTRTITVSAYDYTAVEAGVEGASKTGVIMEQKVTVDKDATTQQIVQKAFDEAGISVTMQNGYSLYVDSINGLGAGQGFSGWNLAYNNDDYSNYGLGSLTLADGDSLRFDYTNNVDTVTDDIGNGMYGNPYVKSLTVAGQTMTMSKKTEVDANWNMTNTFYINGEETKAAGTEEDPYVFEVTLPANEAQAAYITMDTSLNSHYAVIDGWSVSKETYDITKGLDFSVSSLGGKHKSYFTIKTDLTANNTSDSYKEMLDSSIKYIRNTITEAEVGSVGGEWAVLALARYGYEDPEWYTAYYNNVVKYVQNIGSNKLHSRKLTDNSRVIIGLTAIGADPTNVGGYNLLEPLANLEDVVWQGINGPIYALIALDTGDYEIPELPDDSTATQTTREGLIQYILDKELEGSGGWALWGSKADPDITTMAVQALAPYYNTNAEVKAAVDRGMKAISDQQLANGGMGSWGTVNSESCAQTVCALSDLGRDADTDPQYVKNMNSILDAMLSFYIDGGGFAHAAQNGKLSVNMMATEQATYALVSYDRFKTGKTTLYNMSDRKKLYTESAEKKSVEKANVTVADFGLVYDGTVKEPKVTVKYGDILLTEGVDYTKKFSNNVEAGNTAKVTITGMGDYEGQVEKTFSIYSAEIEAADVAVDQTVFVADGKVKKPNVTVTHAGETLKVNTDYTLAFAKNVLPGKATITVTGKGKYTGKVVKYYTLNATHISKTDITVSAEEYVTDGTEKTPAVSVAYNGKTLKSGTDYSVRYIDNVNAGTASVRITGLKYYSGSVEYTFEIKAIELTDAVVTVDTDDIVADGSKKTPTVNVTLGDTVLEAGKDFTVSYFNNVKVGTAKATVTGIGNYTGKIKQAFEIKDGKTEITAATLEDGVVSLEWKAAGAADSYAVYRKAENESEFAKIAETTEISYSDNTAKAGVSYEYEVRPVVGKSFGSSEAVKVAVPAVPAVKLTNTKAGIEVTWNASADADSYVVLRKAGTSDTWEKIADTAKTAYVDKNVTEKTVYTYAVQAVSEVGTSAYTGKTVTRKTPITTLQTPVVTLSNANSGLILRWNKITGAKQYVVYKKAGNAKAWTKVATVKKLSYVDRQVKTGVKYTYAVKATGDYALSSYKAKALYRVDGQDINYYCSPERARIEVIVNKDTAATGYQVQYARSSAFKGAKTVTFVGAKKNTLIVKTAGAGTKYYVRVRSYKKVGKTVYYGAWSSSESVVTEKY